MNKASHSLSINYHSRLYIYLSVLALSAGGLIYILFRTSEPVFFAWIRSAGLGNWLDIVRKSTLNWNQYLPDWLIYSLPNSLWAFGYATIITGIWSGNRFWLKYFWLASIPLLVVGCELMQYQGIIHGTYCLQDLVFGIAGLVIGIFVTLNHLKHGNHE